MKLCIIAPMTKVFYIAHFKIWSPSSEHFKKTKVWIYRMLCIPFNVKLNGKSVFRLINAKYLLWRPFLLLTRLKYQNKKGLNFFNDIYIYITWHAFSSVKFNEAIIYEQINTKFILLSILSFDIFHMVNIGW